MSAEAHPPMPYEGWATLMDAWQQVDMPEGWRVEIVRGTVTLSPPPGRAHNSIADLVHRALAQAIAPDLGIFQTLGVSVPAQSGLFIPDLVVFRRDDLESGPDGLPMPVGKALLVVEITSRDNADTDRQTKLSGYAHGRVPLYLLIDRFADFSPTVSLFSEPVDGHYLGCERVPFGAKVRLPAPFDLDLDTGAF